MPLVLKYTNMITRDGQPRYFSGPAAGLVETDRLVATLGESQITARQLLVSASLMRRAIPRTTDIDCATRFCLLSGSMAILSAAVLKANGIQTEIVYDLPRPLKALRKGLSRIAPQPVHRPLPHRGTELS